MGLLLGPLGDMLPESGISLDDAIKLMNDGDPRLNSIDRHAVKDLTYALPSRVDEFCEAWKKSKVKNLELYAVGLNDEQLAKIIRVLPYNSELKSLGISGQMSGKGLPQERISPTLNTATLEALEQLLPYNSNLESLAIRDQLLNDDRTEIIAGSLPTSLTHLDLGNNQIKDRGAKAIARAIQKLRNYTDHFSLHLFDNQIGDAGGMELAKAWPWKNAQIAVSRDFNEKNIMDLASNQITSAGRISILRTVEQGRASSR